MLPPWAADVLTSKRIWISVIAAGAAVVAYAHGTLSVDQLATALMTVGGALVLSLGIRDTTPPPGGQP